jgi:ubiquinone/menaquinone biosynthesis C-methylase UbiE
MTPLAGLDAARAGFAPIADALRRSVLEYYEATGTTLSGAAGLRTLETNSGLAAARGNSLLQILALHEPALDLSGRAVLDLGCGFGSLAVYLAYLGATVTAADISADRLVVGERVTRAFDLPVTWMHSSLQDLPLGDKAFDIAVVNNSLCYVVPRSDRLIALVQVRRILRPGGWLLMRNPNRTTPRDPFTGLPLLNRLPPRGAALAARALGRHRSNVRLLSARGQRAELRRAGFEAIDIRAARRRTIASVDRWVASYQQVLARRPSV